MIKQCTCVSPDQDRMHGRGNRVMNEAGKGTKWRCTVCKKEYSISSSDTRAKKIDQKEKKK